MIAVQFRLMYKILNVEIGWGAEHEAISSLLSTPLEPPPPPNTVYPLQHW